MKYLLAICLLTALVSCEKDINFNLEDAAPLLVVDAQIENDRAPVVVLTKSLSYFSSLSPQELSNSFLHQAEVWIGNGTLNHRLKEYEYALLPGISAYYYSIDSSNLATAFTGSLGGNYSLRIIAEGQEYLANTSIPASAQYPDSVWFVRAPQNPDTSKRVMYVRATDPPGRGNYYRYFTRVGANQPFFPGEGVFDDQVIDGSTYALIFPPGINRNQPVPRDENFFYRGDTVTLKFTSINQATYKFWSTWEFAYTSIGNPFAQPNKVLGNISNGALGAFCGYAAEYRTYIAH